MAWIGAFGNTPPTLPPKEPKDRSQDLENLIGNYLITDHQLTRLRVRIIDHIKSYQNESTFMFRSDDSKKWFKVNVSVEDVTPNTDADEVTDSGDTAESISHEPVAASSPTHGVAGMIDDDDLDLDPDPDDEPSAEDIIQ